MTVKYPGGLGRSHPRPAPRPGPQDPKERPAEAPTGPAAGDRAAPAALTARQAGSGLETDFLAAVRRLAPELPPFEREVCYAPGRKFRADFLWRHAGLIVECEGGVFGGRSGHNTGTGIENDCLRSRFAALSGFRVFRVTRKSLTQEPEIIVAMLRDIHRNAGARYGRL